MECIKCKREGWLDKAKLVEKLGKTYLVYHAVDVNNGRTPKTLNAQPQMKAPPA